MGTPMKNRIRNWSTHFVFFRRFADSATIFYNNGFSFGSAACVSRQRDDLPIIRSIHYVCTAAKATKLPRRLVKGAQGGTTTTTRRGEGKQTNTLHPVYFINLIIPQYSARCRVPFRVNAILRLQSSATLFLRFLLLPRILNKSSPPLCTLLNRFSTWNCFNHLV